MLKNNGGAYSSATDFDSAAAKFKSPRDRVLRRKHIVKEKRIKAGAMVTGSPYFEGTRRVRRVTAAHEVYLEGLQDSFNSSVLTVVNDD